MRLYCSMSWDTFGIATASYVIDFFTARRYASAVYAVVVFLSVVCPTVTRWNRKYIDLFRITEDVSLQT